MARGGGPSCPRTQSLAVAPPEEEGRHHAARDQALDAVRAFHAEHGRLPRWREWERATASRPCAKTIERRWGWRELLAEAIGTHPNQVDVSWEAVLDERAEAMLDGAEGRAGQARAMADRTEVGRVGTGPTSRGFATPLCVQTRPQQSNTDQQILFRNRWSSSTSSRIASGSRSRCHRHSNRPALSPSPSGAAAHAALIA
jgi:hypothetical protein